MNAEEYKLELLWKLFLLERNPSYMRAMFQLRIPPSILAESFITNVTHLLEAQPKRVKKHWEEPSLKIM